MGSSVQPPDPYEKYRVEEIQKDRSSPKLPPEPPKHSLLVAFLLLVLRKVAYFFESAQEKTPAQKEWAGAHQRLLAFKASLEELQKEDWSQDAPFLNHLSKGWSELLEDSVHFSKNSETGALYRELIRAIQSYPEQKEHTLGYYLSEYAGKQWLPFPYMEMVRKLRSEDVPLAQWIALIDRLASRLLTQYT